MQLGGQVERSTELTGFRVDGDRVIATLSGPDGTSEVEARFLVGADGAHSTVRRGAGIGFAGARLPGALSARRPGPRLGAAAR